MVQRIRDLCERRGTNVRNVEKSCGLTNGSIRRWDGNIPSVEKVARVAKFLGTTVDDLINGGE